MNRLGRGPGTGRSGALGPITGTGFQFRLAEELFSIKSPRNRGPLWTWRYFYYSSNLLGGRGRLWAGFGLEPDGPLAFYGLSFDRQSHLFPGPFLSACPGPDDTASCLSMVGVWPVIALSPYPLLNGKEASLECPISLAGS